MKTLFECQSRHTSSTRHLKFLFALKSHFNNYRVVIRLLSWKQPPGRAAQRFISVPIWCWWGLETVFWGPVCLTTASPGSYHRLPPPVSENGTFRTTWTYFFFACTCFKVHECWGLFSLSSPWAPPASCTDASSFVSAAPRWSEALWLAAPALSDGNGKK